MLVFYRKWNNYGHIYEDKLLIYLSLQFCVQSEAELNNHTDTLPRTVGVSIASYLRANYSRYNGCLRQINTNAPAFKFALMTRGGHLFLSPS